MDAVHAEAEVPPDVAATIARQRTEIESLQRRIAEDRFAQDLRDALTTASTAGAIGAPVSYSRLMEIIVVTAADIIDAKIALLCLIDTDQDELVFEVAFDADGIARKGVRTPLGDGVAGLVALTGQPIAISDTAADDRDANDIAAAVGFSPKNILCVPLSFQDEVIGVLELLDKQGADAFDVADMEAIGLFANMAAMLLDLIQAVDGTPDYDRYGLTKHAREFTTHLGHQSGFRDALDLARLVQEVVHHGDAAAQACKRILDGFVQYLRSSDDTVDFGGAP